MKLRKAVQGAFFVFAALAMSFSAKECAAQSAAPGPMSAAQNIQQQSDKAPAVFPEYQIGPGDIVSVTIAEGPELSGKFRVSQEGQLTLPALEKPIQTSGMTPRDLAETVKKELVKANLFKNPTVNVFVDEYHGYNVTVLGAVQKPGTYPLPKPTTVLEAVSLAGGLSPNAGNTLTLVRKSADGTGGQETRTINLAKLERGNRSEQNFEVRNGDVISVSTAEIVYVVGAVLKPGGFAYPDQSAGMTALQALALAEGPNSVAKTSHAVIIRRSANEADRQDIALDLSKVLKGSSPDFLMQANDILFIPVSGRKVSLKVAGDIGMAAVNGAALYGLGYRIGNGNL